MEKFKTRKEFAEELGMKPITMMRKLASKNFLPEPGLLSPESQREIRELLNVRIVPINQKPAR